MQLQTEGALSFRENMGKLWGRHTEAKIYLSAKETEGRHAPKECGERVILKSFRILCRKRVEGDSKTWRHYYKQQTESEGDIKVR